MKKSFLIWFFILALSFTGCQSAPPLADKPTPDIGRRADTPLVVAIPGLNIPLAPNQAQHFGDIVSMLASEGIPSCVLVYDSATHPLRDAADLSTSDYSIAVTRILPGLTGAIEEENDIRAAQGLPPLTEVNLVSYSQGSVMTLDIAKRLYDFKDEFAEFLKAAGPEWDALKQDPELDLFLGAADDYLVIKNIKLQRQNDFKRDYDLKRFYERAAKRLAKAFERFRLYLTQPEKIYPNTPLVSGNEKGYPRAYPGILSWFQTVYPATTLEDSIQIEFWTRYAEYAEILPIRFRFFSITGSFFGSPRANQGYFLLKALPGVDRLVMDKASVRQIEETRLGSHHHLDTLKHLITRDKEGRLAHPENFYFIVGANGEKGDGLVDQSSAHLSSHMLTEIPFTKLDEAVESEAASKTPLVFKYDKLPNFAVSGLEVDHLPKNHLISRTAGAAEMSKNSEVYPYLVSFVKQDYKKLNALRTKEKARLRQFMVELNLPKIDELKGWEFTLRPDSKNIKISTRYFNPSANTIVWTGVFKSKKNFLSLKEIDPTKQASVILKATKPNTLNPLLNKIVEVKLTVTPGTNHFVEIEADKAAKTGSFKISLPSVFDFIPKNDFWKMMKGEK